MMRPVPVVVAVHESVVALLGPREMSDLSPQSGPKRTLIRSLSPIAIYSPWPQLIVVAIPTQGIQVRVLAQTFA